MSQELRREALEVAQWFNEHRKETSDLQKRVEFLERAVDHLLWLMGRVVDDVAALEHLEKAGVRSELIHIAPRFSGLGIRG